MDCEYETKQLSVHAWMNRFYRVQVLQRNGMSPIALATWTGEGTYARVLISSVLGSFSETKFVLVWLRLAWLRLAWLGLGWFGLDWIGLSWIGLAWLGLACIGLDGVRLA